MLIETSASAAAAIAVFHRGPITHPPASAERFRSRTSRPMCCSSRSTNSSRGSCLWSMMGSPRHERLDLLPQLRARPAQPSFDGALRQRALARNLLDRLLVEVEGFED